MRILAVGFAILMTGCAAKNDPELAKRISVTAALADVRSGVTDFSQGLLQDNVFLGVRLCTIKVNLALSANATQDNHAGLAVTAGYSGVSATGNASTNSSAADQRGNTVEMVFRSIDVVACPPQEAAPAAAKPDDTTKQKNGPAVAGGGAPGRPPADPRQKCLDLDFRKKNPPKPEENMSEWLNRICGPGTMLVKPVLR